jgi:uncharacterized protein (DUF1697 family)
MSPRRQVALSRGINVGRAKRVPMAGLREALAAEGLENVRTLLNSGNVVFDGQGAAQGNADRIARTIERCFDVSARVIGLTARELATIVDENPLVGGADDPSRLLVSVWSSPEIRRSLDPLVKKAWRPERLALGSRAAYLWCPSGVLESKLNAALTPLLGDRVTTRNWRTMLKLRELAVADDHGANS